MKVGDSFSQSKPKKQAECLVSGAMYLMLRVSQIVGIGPVRFDTRPGGGRHVSVSSAMTILNFIIISTINVCVFTGLILDLNQQARSPLVSSKTHRYVWAINVIASLVVLSIPAYKAPKRMTDLIRCWDNVQKLGLGDYHRIMSDEVKKCVAIVTYAVIEVGFTILYFNAYISLAELAQTEKRIMYMFSFYFIGCMLVRLIKMQIIFTTLELQMILKSLNNELQGFKFLIKQQQGFKTSTVSQPLSKLMNNLVNKYQQLYGVVQQLNDCFEPEMLAVITLCLMQLVTTPHALYQSYVKGVTDYYELGILLVSMVWNAMSVIVLVEPCHKTQIEMEHTNWLVSYLLLETTDDQVEAELEKLFNFLVSNKIEYSPMGVCKFSRGLVVLIFSKVATFVQIIMQFQLSEQ